MNRWILRKSQMKDLNKIYQIVDQARNLMKAENNFQWNDQYPTIKDCEQDIKNGHSYLLEENGKIIATQAISVGPPDEYFMALDPENKYLKVNDKTKKYAVISRLAVSNEKSRVGIGFYLLNQAERICREKKASSIWVLIGPANIKTQIGAKKLGYLYHAKVQHPVDKSVWMLYQKVLGPPLSKL